MLNPVAALLFPEALKYKGLRAELGKTHGLNDKDFDWLAHVTLVTQALRSQQSPPMLAQSVQIKAGTLPALTLAGVFILSATPDDCGAILYTPFGGIKKYDSLPALQTALRNHLESTDEDDDMFAFLALAQRRQVTAHSRLTLSYETIEGDIFAHQGAAIQAAQQLNAEAMLDELKQLPSLASLLEKILDGRLSPHFPNIEQTLSRVSFYSVVQADGSAPETGKHWHDSMSLSEAVLRLYHRGWPVNRLHEFSNPGHDPASGDQATWEAALKEVAGKLVMWLFREMERYWDGPSADGSPRRVFFAKALTEQARADLMIKRESEILTASQFATLHQMISPASLPGGRPILENVRLWEYEPNYVELAGSLMISHANAFLYTPSMGLQVLQDYNDLKDTVHSKFLAPGHEDELFGLLSLEERKRFIGFGNPHVSGESLAGETFAVLFEAIITKQRKNIEFALQVFSLSDGTVDIHALFDKALDIRSMIHERLLELNTGERWSTRPALPGVQQASEVLAEKTRERVRTLANREALLAGAFRVQPSAVVTEQRRYLENLQPLLAAGWVEGITGEAQLRVLSGSLRADIKAIVDTVFTTEHANRDNRGSLNGFRPDAWSLTLDSASGQTQLPLAHCVMLTERGGLDAAHSGHVVLWTPATGLEVFTDIVDARRVLNQRLKDSVGRLALVENLAPKDRQFHQDYTLGALQLIKGDVPRHSMQSAIEYFLARCDQARQRLHGDSRLASVLTTLKKTVIDTNLLRTLQLGKAIDQQQSLPAWLGMASPQDQQRHLELLEQWRHSVTDHKDYLSDLPDLANYVDRRLKTLLDQRFPGNRLEPKQIRITPNLALAGPPRPLSEFALNHINVAQGTGFKVASTTTQALPQGFDQNAVRRLLLSLDISTTYGQQVAKALAPGSDNAEVRQQRFLRQLPWQLLQHAHGLKLQQRLSAKAFDYLCQVFDMPDGVARATVEGAHALVAPLSLAKTAGVTAVEVPGLYVIGPGNGDQGPLVLYSLYADEVFHEFEEPQGLIAALNKPGALQDLLLRRLPTEQQAVFQRLLQSSVGETSEMVHVGIPVQGNLLARLFTDNLALLQRFLGCQSLPAAQDDWEAAKNLFSKGIHLLSRLLPGKLSYVTFLWQAYKDFKDSAEALQDHHWKQALQAFIGGAVQMLSLSRESLLDAEDVPARVEAPAVEDATSPSAAQAPTWHHMRTTSPLRTELQSFETHAVALADLKHNRRTGVYEDSISGHSYATVGGKVYGVEQPGAVWQLVKGATPGPSLRMHGTHLVIAADRHTAHFGKVVSRLYEPYRLERERRAVLNIEAVGMKDIQAQHPRKAQAIQQAVDLARFYAFNSLHNLALLKNNAPSLRLEAFFRDFFGVQQVDTRLLKKIHNAIVPICNALVDPDDDLMNTDRFVVGSNTTYSSIIAFVLNNDQRKRVHFTEHFFNPALDRYNAVMTQPFDVDAHAQAATLIHELAHQFCKAEDIASLESRRPFADLISTVTLLGLSMRHDLQSFQRRALSLATPRDELFSHWSRTRNTYVNLDQVPGGKDLSKIILDLTSSPTLDEARTAFLDQGSSDIRIDVILRNADSIAHLICEMGRQLDPPPAITP